MPSGHLQTPFIYTNGDKHVQIPSTISIVPYWHVSHYKLSPSKQDLQGNMQSKQVLVKVLSHFPVGHYSMHYLTSKSNTSASFSQLHIIYEFY